MLNDNFKVTGARIPGQLSGVAQHPFAVSALQTLRDVEAANKARRVNEGVVNLEILPNYSNPQYMAIYGDNGNIRRQVGRIHNTNLANLKGLQYAFHEVKGSIHKNLGLSESTEVSWGDLKWRPGMFPRHVEKMIGEAIERVGINLTGTFGPQKVITPKRPIREFKFFNRPPSNVHDGPGTPTRLEEAVLSQYGTRKPANKKGIFGVEKALALEVSRMLEKRGFDKNWWIKVLSELPRIQYKVKDMATSVYYVKGDKREAIKTAATSIVNLLLRGLAGFGEKK